ncbi:MFS transporter [Novosphingobium album (ex Liu et al. 2023)]|uniref:MFS transporter n=1 Tax=Novosphingobium album (ex Liu et al. 2023) TaxID=3031130 RepID=A0ABT5WR61_9SPHN|nr:MFS transporter [Novosphingobium album (ex Liu et al. 2023)]MDE8652518.1 MFS transporter [Novosphingobium album (ex Liu et al. 2023)]
MGTAIEFYDFFIYGTAAALVFGPLFFPAQSQAAQTLLALMSFGIAFFARPVGAVAFGHFGDRIGRKSTLVASLLMMGLSTLAVALLPTYATAGWIAPALLCLMRFGQGFGLGGEWGGAALLAAEHAPEGWAFRFVSIMQLGSPLGFLAANGVFLALGAAMDDAAFMAWGWRIPFLASGLLVAVGLYVRFRIEETPAFREALKRAAPVRLPFLEVLTRHWRAVLCGSAGVVATFALFYLATAFALAQASGPLGYDRQAFLAVQMGASLLYIGAILIAGALGDRLGPAPLLTVAALGTVAVGLGFQAGLESGSLLLAGLAVGAAMFVLGFANAPLGGWLATLFPVRVRYSGVSLAFNGGGIVGGALLPIAAQALTAARFGHSSGVVLIAAGLITLAGVRFGGQRVAAHA